jgi:hypothetical protein
MWEVILAVYILALAFMLYLIHTAPLGYEDERGFHYGRPDDES